MRINGSFAYDPKDLRSKPAKPGESGKPGATDKAGSTQASAAAETAPSALVNQAGAVEEVNLQAVEEARRLLENGQLDTPEAAESAARNIIERGV